MTTLMLRVSQLKPNIFATILEIAAEPLVRERLLELGLAPGRSLMVLRNLPLSGPVVVQSGSLTVALRKEEAESLWVKI